METIQVGSWTPAPELAYSNLSNPSEWLLSSAFGGISNAGIPVNQFSALSLPTVYQAVTTIADDMASLPINVVREGRTNAEKHDRKHPIYKLFNVKCHPTITPFHVRQCLEGWKLLHGNGIAAIGFSETGVPISLTPMPPGTVRPARTPNTQEFRELGAANLDYYEWTLPDGTQGKLWPHEVFHVKLFGNGFWGMSPIELFTNMLGNGIAMSDYQGHTFRNRSTPAGVIVKETGGDWKPEARENFRKEWNEMHSGVHNTNKIALLQGGLKYQAIGTNAKDAEALGQLKHFRELVASVWKLPPHKVGALENSAVRANIEEQGRSYVQSTLTPHGVGWQQESQMKLCARRGSTEFERGACKAEFDFDQLTKPGRKERFEGYRIGREVGILSSNDCRDLEGMDGIGAQGDTYNVPANWADQETGMPIGGTQPTATVEVAAEPADGMTDAAAEMVLSYNREHWHRVQEIETKELARIAASSKDLNAAIDPLYERVTQRLYDLLGPLCHLPGFVDPYEMQELVMGYVEESREMLQGLDKPSIPEALAEWPKRVESYVQRLRKAEDDGT